MALPTEYTEDWGFNALGPELGVAVVEPYAELPDSPLHLLAIAPASGLFAAAGAHTIVVGELAQLRAALRADAPVAPVATIEHAAPIHLTFSASEAQLFVCSTDFTVSAYRTSDWTRAFTSAPVPAPVVDMRAFTTKQGVVIATPTGVIAVDEDGDITAISPDAVFALAANDDVLTPSHDDVDAASLGDAIGPVRALAALSPGWLLLVADSAGADDDEYVTFVRHDGAWHSVDNALMGPDAPRPLTWHQGAVQHWPTQGTFTAVAVSSYSSELMLISRTAVWKPMNETDNLPFTTSDEDVIAVGGALDVTDTTPTNSVPGIEGKFPFPLWLVLTQEGRILGWHVVCRDASKPGVELSAPTKANVPDLKTIKLNLDIAEEEIDEITESEARDSSQAAAGLPDGPTDGPSDELAHSPVEGPSDGPSEDASVSDTDDKDLQEEQLSPDAGADGPNASGDITSGLEPDSKATKSDEISGTSTAESKDVANARTAKPSGTTGDDAPNTETPSTLDSKWGSSLTFGTGTANAIKDNESSAFSKTSFGSSLGSKPVFGSAADAPSLASSKETANKDTNDAASADNKTALPKTTFGSSWGSKPGFSSWASNDGNKSPFAPSGTEAKAPSLFGSNSSAAFGAPKPATAAPATSIFGQKPISDSGSIFGQKPSSSGSLFGQKTSDSSSFFGQKATSDPFAAFRNQSSPFKSETTPTATGSGSKDGDAQTNTIQQDTAAEPTSKAATEGHDSNAGDAAAEAVEAEYKAKEERKAREAAEAERRAEEAVAEAKAAAVAEAAIKAEAARAAEAARRAEIEKAEAEKAEAAAAESKRQAAKIESTSWLGECGHALITPADALREAPLDGLSDMDTIYAQTNLLFQVLDHNLSVLERSGIYEQHAQVPEFSEFAAWSVGDVPALGRDAATKLGSRARNSKLSAEAMLKHVSQLSYDAASSVADLPGLEAVVAEARADAGDTAYRLRPLPARSAHYRRELQAKLGKIARLMREARESVLLKRTELGETIEFANFLAAVESIDSRLLTLESAITAGAPRGRGANTDSPPSGRSEPIAPRLSRTPRVAYLDHSRGFTGASAAVIDAASDTPMPANNVPSGIMLGGNRGPDHRAALREQLSATDGVLNRLKQRAAGACITTTDL